MKQIKFLCLIIFGPMTVTIGQVIASAEAEVPYKKTTQLPQNGFYIQYPDPEQEGNYLDQMVRRIHSVKAKWVTGHEIVDGYSGYSPIKYPACVTEKFNYYEIDPILRAKYLLNICDQTYDVVMLWVSFLEERKTKVLYPVAHVENWGDANEEYAVLNKAEQVKKIEPCSVEVIASNGKTATFNCVTGLGHREEFITLCGMWVDQLLVQNGILKIQERMTAFQELLKVILEISPYRNLTRKMRIIPCYQIKTVLSDYAFLFHGSVKMKETQPRIWNAYHNFIKWGKRNGITRVRYNEMSMEMKGEKAMNAYVINCKARDLI